MKWFILRVQGRKVPQLVEELGDLCWWPTKTKLTKPARKHKPVEVTVPLIPGWLFVKEVAYGAYDERPGVYGVLKYGRFGTLWIDDKELDGLRSAVDVAKQSDVAEPLPPIGSVVTLRGLLYGRKGWVIEHRGADTCKIDLGNLVICMHISLIEVLQ